MGSVLIVDDLPANRLLAPDKHAVRTAGDGDEALA